MRACIGEVSNEVPWTLAIVRLTAHLLVWVCLVADRRHRLFLWICLRLSSCRSAWTVAPDAAAGAGRRTATARPRWRLTDTKTNSDRRLRNRIIMWFLLLSAVSREQPSEHGTFLGRHRRRRRRCGRAELGRLLERLFQLEGERYRVPLFEICQRLATALHREPCA